MIAETERWPCDSARLRLTIDDLENAAKAISQQPPRDSELSNGTTCGPEIFLRDLETTIERTAPALQPGTEIRRLVDVLMQAACAGLLASLGCSSAGCCLVCRRHLHRDGDRHDRRPRSDNGKARASLIAAAVNMGGLGAGPLLVGILAQYAPLPRSVCFVVDLALVVIAVLGVQAVAEPVQRASTPYPRPRKIDVPIEIRGVFTRAAIAGFAVLGCSPRYPRPFSLPCSMCQGRHVVSPWEAALISR